MMNSRPGIQGNDGNKNSRPGTHRERRERKFKTRDTPGTKGTMEIGSFDWLKRIAEVSTFCIILTFCQCRNVSSSVETSLSEVLTFCEIPNGFRPTTLIGVLYSLQIFRSRS